jgi:hypothetical protein
MSPYSQSAPSLYSDHRVEHAIKLLESIQERFDTPGVRPRNRGRAASRHPGHRVRHRYSQRLACSAMRPLISPRIAAPGAPSPTKVHEKQWIAHRVRSPFFESVCSDEGSLFTESEISEHWHLLPDRLDGAETILLAGENRSLWFQADVGSLRGLRIAGVGRPCACQISSTVLRRASGKPIAANLEEVA